ncbi:MAG: hypothetical protein K6A23_00045, partial [Butyrivibrio sp.]|nr:hypothetical protein [Butyrivibrio sp.]
MSEFVITIHVNDEKELYSEFDPSGMSFSNEFAEYLKDYIEDRKIGEKVCYEVFSYNQIDMERLRKAYLLHLDKLHRRNQRDIKRNRL